MSLKESIKSKICIEPHLANFPFQSFIEWTSEYNESRVLFCLNVLQHELDAEKEKLERVKSERVGWVEHSDTQHICFDDEAI